MRDHTDDNKDALLAAIPDAEKRFKKATTQLNQLILDIRKHFPEAHFFGESESLYLMLKSDDAPRATERQEGIALRAHCLHFGGGAW